MNKKQKRFSLVGLFILISAVSSWSITEQEMGNWVSYREAQIQEASLKTRFELVLSHNILHITPDRQEWEALETILNEYFSAIEEEYRPEHLARLEAELAPFGIYMGNRRPIGYYQISRQEIHLNYLLFKSGANAGYSKSILYHELTHKYQNLLIDPVILKIDQRQSYQEKLEEVGAHYNQILYVLQYGDMNSIYMTLENSYRQKMFPTILASYPSDDQVIRLIKAYQAEKKGVEYLTISASAGS